MWTLAAGFEGAFGAGLCGALGAGFAALAGAGTDFFTVVWGVTAALVFSAFAAGVVSCVELA